MKTVIEIEGREYIVSHRFTAKKIDGKLVNYDEQENKADFKQEVLQVMFYEPVDDNGNYQKVFLNPSHIRALADSIKEMQTVEERFFID